MTIKISVIMPLYNADAYLRESLDSVLHQTFTDFELICINDASADTTGDILNEYQNKDSRIKILINADRSGAAHCRNIGIKAAKGEYLSFLDGDDIFDEEMLETAYRTAIEKKAEIVMFDYKHVSSDVIHKREFVQHSSGFLEKYVTNTFSVLEKHPYEIIIWSASPCNKIYRKSFIDINRLAFQDLPSSNDVYFVAMSLLLSKKAIVINDNRIMVYAREHNQPARISNDRNPMCAYLAVEKVKKELIKRGLFEMTALHYFYYAFLHLFTALTRTKNSVTALNFYHFLQNEGINCLGDYNLHQKKYMDKYICSKMKLFLHKSFESQWYKYESILNIYLEKRQILLENLFLKYRQNNIRVGVWGAGINGQIFIKFCNCHHFKLDMVVDADKNKQGKWLDGYLISSPQNAYGVIQVMLISAQFIYRQVRETIRKYDKNMEAVDILQFLNIT